MCTFYCDVFGLLRNWFKVNKQQAQPTYAVQESYNIFTLFVIAFNLTLVPSNSNTSLSIVYTNPILPFTIHTGIPTEDENVRNLYCLFSYVYDSLRLSTY